MAVLLFMAEHCYVYPELSRWDFLVVRALGPGLGNLLFPWARAFCYAKQHDLSIIWPTWPQIKIGPILRREPDLRLYSNLFARPDNYLGGLRKALLLTASHVVKETELPAMIQDQKCSQRPLVIRFSGMDGTFSPLVGSNKILNQELLRITQPQHKAALNVNFAHSISVHVRLGDFSKPDVAALKMGRSNTQIPLDWYTDTISRLRTDLGERLPVHLFSDGSDEQLSELLRMPDVERLTFKSSIADMVALSRANVLVSSASTFSMWASFLGLMPTILFPGQLKQHFNSLYPETEVERDYREGFSNPFLQSIIRTAALSLGAL